MPFKYLIILGILIFPTRMIAQSGTGIVQPDSGVINVDSNKTIIIPLMSLSADDLESETQNQDVSSLLQSSRDVFTSVAGFNFSAARYRMRGYGSEHLNLMMNGVPMHDREMGWNIWAYWGGLNDITRYPEVANGLSANRFNFGAIGGFSNVTLRASDIRAGSRVSYAATNRTYRNRVMLTHSTGKMDNGWSFAASGAYRWSEEGYVDGTYFSGASYFLSAEKTLNKRHSIGLAGLGAPTVQARQGIALQEVYDLTGNNYYNPYWGYQNDGATKRNSRVRNNHRPSAFLTHYWQIDTKSKLTSSLYGTFGRTGSTNLNWYDASDPRPDYYRYLPSYFEIENPSEASRLAEAWANDPSTSQIDWDALYNANYKNLYTLEDAEGISGNTVTFNRSKYIVEDYRMDPRQIGLNTVYQSSLMDKFNLSTGLRVERYTSHNFKVLEDLLGGDYWVDVDQFAERDFADDQAAQNNLDAQNQLISEGETFGYSYDIHVNTEEAFGQLSGTHKNIEWYTGLMLSHTSFWRDGLWANGRFPNDSKGESEKQQFFNYGVKGGLVYKVTGRHIVTAKGQYQTKAPNSRNAFVSPRTRNAVVQGLESTEILSGELTYLVRYPNLKARATLFYSEINNQTWARSFYHDEFRNFVNYVMTGVDHQHIGGELGIQANVTSTLQLQGAFALGEYRYNSRPVATITRDNSASVMAENRTVYLKNYRIGGTPQTALSLGFRYNSPKYWFAGFNANFFWDLYLSPNPDRRTEEALDKYVSSDPQWSEILDQTKLDNGYALNAYIGKSWKIDDSFIRFNLSVNNVLNNTDFITGGYEQLRFDANDPNRFPSKFGYMYGTTFFAMITYLF